MTAFAVGEAEVAAEAAAAVMTGGARLSARAAEVLGRRGGTDLACLRRARG